MALSFRKGVVLPGHKTARGKKIKLLPAPAKVSVPVEDRDREEGELFVAVGDRVLLGQKIALEKGAYPTPVHASLSGRIIGIRREEHRSLVEIENDYRNTLSPEVCPFSKKIVEAEPEELIGFIRDAGIVGLGGAAFPVWAKLENARGKVKRLIINCAESEPWLCADHRLLLDKTNEIIGGAKILLQASGAEKAVFALESNKEDAAEKLLAALGDNPRFPVRVLKTKYPQGDERHLAAALFGKEIKEEERPVDLGLIFFNPETAWSVYRAFVNGLPLVERTLTVGGSAAPETENLSVPLGTSFEEALRFAGGLSAKAGVVLNGGPMMGKPQNDLSSVVGKETAAILALAEEVRHGKGVCIRCGRCRGVCPMRLVPLELLPLIRSGKLNKADARGLSACTECGACAFVCPADVPLMPLLHAGKAALAAEKENESQEIGKGGENE